MAPRPRQLWNALWGVPESPVFEVEPIVWTSARVPNVWHQLATQDGMAPTTPLPVWPPLRYTMIPKAHPLEYATDGSNGLDLWTADRFSLPPAQEFRQRRSREKAAVLVDTGIAIAIPHGYVGLVFERSSLYREWQIGLANKVGVIDGDYRGTIKLALINYVESEVPRNFDKPLKAAQLVIVAAPRFLIEKAEALDATERGDGGFGSTT